MEKIIEASGLFFSYNHRPILEDISFEVMENDFLSILGPNGGGKTTLLKLILGFIKPLKGTISILGENPEKARKNVGYVSQFSLHDRKFPMSVYDLVLSGFITNESLFPWYSREQKEKVKNLLNLLKISKLKNEIVGNLSGGERQRALIARALTTNPKLLLLDEPTASLDTSIERDIYKLLKELNSKMTIVMVTHDVGVISSYVNRVACLNRNMKYHSIDDFTFNEINNMYSYDTHLIQHKCNL